MKKYVKPSIEVVELYSEASVLVDMSSPTNATPTNDDSANLYSNEKQFGGGGIWKNGE